MKIVEYLLNIYREYRDTGHEYELSLEELIERSEKRFREGTGMDYPICFQCYVNYGIKRLMMFRHSQIVVSVVPVRDDITFKCVSCYHTTHHGIPMLKKDALEEIRLRGNSPYLMRPTYRMYERTDGKVMERLIKLGYLE